MSMYMETTKIPADRTAAEVVAELVKARAKSINVDYENGQPQGIQWILTVDGVDRCFRLPARIKPILHRLRNPNQAQAERVAWRQLLRWVQAQNAMIAAWSRRKRSTRLTRSSTVRARRSSR